MPFRAGTAWRASTYDRAEKLVSGSWQYAWSHVNFLDLTSGAADQTVRASAGGFARLVTPSEGKVVVDHGSGWKTVYQHMQPVQVDTVGRQVNAGDPLGTVGKAGTASGIHLHYTQLKDDVAQVPVFDGIGSYAFGTGSTYGPFTTATGTYRLLNDRNSTSALTASDAHCAPTLPAQPTGPRVTSVSTSSAALGWTDASNNETAFVSQYRIGTGPWVAGPSVGGNATSMTVGGLTANTTYTFQVGAKNAAGTKWSVYFYGKTAAPPTLPAQPTNPNVWLTTSSAVVGWSDASNNETRFVSQYRIGTGPWVAGPSVGANVTSMTINGLAANTTYTFQVGAQNAAGTKWSVYFYGKTAALPPPPVSYAGHIVQWSGDTKTQKTSWYVTSDSRRLYIPDSGTYYCLKGRGAPGPTVLSSTQLNALPDQTNKSAACGDWMNVDRTLRRGMGLRSSDGRYNFILQTDGNLVLYGPTGRAIWANNRFNTAFVTFQSDGNLVGYTDAGVPTWYTGTAGSGANVFYVQSDGNLVIYAGSRAVWSSGTAGRT
jgi:hypothetical protein